MTCAEILDSSGWSQHLHKWLLAKGLKHHSETLVDRNVHLLNMGKQYILYLSECIFTGNKKIIN